MSTASVLSPLLWTWFSSPAQLPLLSSSTSSLCLALSIFSASRSYPVTYKRQSSWWMKPCHCIVCQVWKGICSEVHICLYLSDADKQMKFVYWRKPTDSWCTMRGCLSCKSLLWAPVTASSPAQRGRGFEWREKRRKREWRVEQARKGRCHREKESHSCAKPNRAQSASL